MKDKCRILLVLSGGTICTSVHEENGLKTRKISGGSDVLLKKYFYESDSKYKDAVTIETSENFGILSENMTVEKWNALLKFFREKDNICDYDGIIIAHGTDTLAYSASMFSLTLKALNIPVFLVSSNLPLSEEGANGNANFKAAAELICKGIPANVYVTYKNINDGILYLHLGSRLRQCAGYDENFYSAGALAVPEKTDSADDIALPEDWVKAKSDKYDGLISYKNLRPLTACVLKLSPYVGLDYDAFDLSKFKAVLHGTYHSGTVCENTQEYETCKSSSSVWKLIDKAAGKCGIYVSPSDLSGEIYDSVARLLKSGVCFFSGSTEETVYCKLLIAYSSGLSDTEEIKDFLDADICGELCYK